MGKAAHPIPLKHGVLVSRQEPGMALLYYLGRPVYLEGPFNAHALWQVVAQRLERGGESAPQKEILDLSQRLDSLGLLERETGPDPASPSMTEKWAWVEISPGSLQDRPSWMRTEFAGQLEFDGVIAIGGWSHFDRIRQFESQMWLSRKTWLPVIIEPRSVLFGPRLSVDNPFCWTCLALRRKGNLTRAELNADEHLGFELELPLWHWDAVQSIGESLAKRGDSSAVTEYGFMDGRFLTHSVLPVPYCDGCARKKRT